MKFPSLVKLPKYKKFNFEPRYYDPVKEEIDMRSQKIKLDMEAQRRAGTDDRAQFKAELEQVLNRRATEDRNSTIMQAVFVLLLLLIFTGYLFYGNNVIYGALILVPLYILYRSGAFSRKKRR